MFVPHSVTDLVCCTGTYSQMQGFCACCCVTVEHSPELKAIQRETLFRTDALKLSRNSKTHIPIQRCGRITLWQYENQFGCGKGADQPMSAAAHLAQRPPPAIVAARAYRYFRPLIETHRNMKRRAPVQHRAMKAVWRMDIPIRTRRGVVRWVYVSTGFRHVAVLPSGWQGKTPFTYRRLYPVSGQPAFGSLVRSIFLRE